MTIKTTFVTASFLVLSWLLAVDTMAATTIQDTAGQRMTVAKVYAEKYSGPGSIEVTFYESARFYRLLKSDPQWKEYVSILKEALKKREPVCVWLAAPGGNIIKKVSRYTKDCGGG